MYLSLPTEIQLARIIQETWSKVMNETTVAMDCCPEDCCDGKCCFNCCEAGGGTECCPVSDETGLCC